MLLCGVADELRGDVEPRGDRLALFFCEAGNRNADNAVAILRGLIYLLISQQSGLISHVLSEHENVGSKLFEGPGAWYSLRAIFLALLPEVERVTYLAVDALDECGDDLDRLLSLIAETAKRPGTRIKWLVTSRRRADVARRLEVGKAGRQGVDLDECTEELTRAVGAYVDRCAAELAEGVDDDGGLRQRISEGLREKAGGTFQYVTLAVAKLKAVSTFEMLDVLREAAPDIEGLYRQASDRIQHLERETRHLCRSVLATVAIAHRPLRREELYALSGLPSNNAAAADDILRKCNSFGISGLTTFSVDASAREFLSGDRVLFPEGLENEHRRVFLRSLGLMEGTLRRNIYDLGNPGALAVDIRVPEPDPLAAARYACEYFIEHLVSSRYHGRDTRDDGALNTFLEFNPWAQTLEPGAGGLDIVGPVAFSPDGAWLAAALQGDDRHGETSHEVHVWDAVTGNHVWTLQDAGGWMAFPHNSSLLGTAVSGGGVPGVRFFDLAKGAWHHREIGLLDVSAAAFSPDGVWLAAADGDYLGTWDWERGDCPLRFRHGSTSAAGSVAYSADGTRLASAHRAEIRIWNARSGSQLRCISNVEVTLVAFSPVSSAGGELISASNESLITWSVETGERIGMLNVPSEHDPYSAVGLSADGRYFAAAPEGTIVTWETATRRRLQTLEGYDRRVRSLVFSPDGRQLATIGAWGLRLYRAAASTDGGLLRAARDHPEKISIMQVSSASSGGAIMVSASASTMKIWDLAADGGCGLRREIRTAQGGILDVVLSPDGGQLVSLSSREDAAVWDTTTGRRVQTIPDYGAAASFSRDAAQVAILTVSGTLKGGAGSVAFAPEVGCIAASLDRTIRLWKLRRRRYAKTLEDDETAKGLHFSSDGLRLAASYHGRIKIWDPSNGSCLQTLDTGGSRRANIMAFDTVSCRLLTDVGLLVLDGTHETPAQGGTRAESVGREIRRQGYGVDADSGWVTWNSQKMLWLPPAYRPDSTAVFLAEPTALTPSTIALGCRSGRVVVLRFPTRRPPAEAPR
ncbi:quinon protein alcohol dehydrogenase-like superfamily [Chaetomium sp. MPI-CAGE-AT-0009]|nr:quinon protein alcohol dehydrogenase-like superfamily [Chaetomium sp. MPI-CAGE-AT-0009]